MFNLIWLAIKIHTQFLFFGESDVLDFFFLKPLRKVQLDRVSEVRQKKLIKMNW